MSYALDKSSSVPLYVQLAHALEKDIRSGAYPPGSRLPTEHELGDRHGLSRVTVRKALEHDSLSPLLERHPGKGTYVASRKLSRSISGVTTFSEMCRLQGMRPGARTIRLELEDATCHDREQLRLKDGERVLLLARIRYADDVPVSLETSRFSEDYLFLLNEDLTDASLYAVLASHGIHYTASSKLVSIKLADYAESRYLDVERGHPLLKLDSVVSDDGDLHRSISQQLCVADRFALAV